MKRKERGTILKYWKAEEMNCGLDNCESSYSDIDTKNVDDKSSQPRGTSEHRNIASLYTVRIKVARKDQ
jgi:hypothetical protein